MKLTKIYKDFFSSEKTGGLLLLAATFLSLILSNSSWGEVYTGFWQIKTGGHTLVHWINDGLMAIFFLLIGLELEREIYNGELSKIKNASLPFSGAIGGMIVPAAIFLLFNFGTNSQSGAGIPMATDIAFAVGILSLLGNRVPSSLKVFLTTLAVVDDIGAILIIAIFYSKSISVTYLLLVFVVMGILFIFNKLKVYKLVPYLIGGVLMWYFMLHSGVHATITGILLAFVIPFGDGSAKSISNKLEHFLHKPVAYIILPIFALANTSIALTTGWYENLLDYSSLGIILGLVIGKPVGIFTFTYLASLLKIAILPRELNWRNIIGSGFLAGIGFTMSIFITLLAFEDIQLIDNSKVAILVASAIAGITGLAILFMTLKKKYTLEEESDEN
ncbi:MAG: Na+/H+ antiporter NhaA [Ignavibacteria bacterium GWF2_33_9]|nr:MAG: Na+/H+ antiporter NhaA [Ignavibacteria bacterium GWF2_33_9]